MTIDDIEAWLVACEDLLATSTNENPETKACQIRHVVGGAMAQVNDILEGFHR